MALPPTVFEPVRKIRASLLQRTKPSILVVLSALFILCLVFLWTTRDAMSHLPSVAGRGQGPAGGGTGTAIVDLSPWQTAQALAALAVTAEEHEHAQEAERLADHEVDQAFASALREATIQAEHRTLSGEALALSQRIDELQQLVNQDQALVHQLSGTNGAAPAAKGPVQPVPSETDLDIAKAQLQLDSDELADAQQDLARASGDERGQIQSELNAHEVAMRKYDAQERGDGQIAVLSASRYATLSGRIGAWNRQLTRYNLIKQAITQTQADVRKLTDEHNALEAKADANTSATAANAQDRTAKLAAIKDQSAERQLLSIYDDRIQTEQQLVAVYTKWSAQVLLQHRILLHLILRSVAVIVFILLCMVIGDELVRRVTSHPALDRRQLQTLRMILELTVQIVGIALILIILFGMPHETPTILGLTTAALTIALQDFVLAFFGWFVLMGRKGIRVGDWVEINGVGGEVTEIGLMRTTLLETGNLNERGYPTGRRIIFMNSFAIRGQYFNFSTAGQWMWDQITVSVPAAVDAHVAVDRILHTVEQETKENSRVAEQEWKRGTRGDGLSKFRTDPAVNLRPSGSGVDIEVRYVTRASERFEMRNRLYREVLNVLHQQPGAEQAEPAV